MTKTYAPSNLKRIRLVGYEPNHSTTPGGISNYVQHLVAHMRMLDSNLQIGGAAVRHFLRVEPYNPGEILHVSRIMGSQALLTGRYPCSIVSVMDLGALLSPQDQRDNSRYHKIVFRLALQGVRRAKHIFAISEHTKATLITHLSIPSDRITVTYLGVDHTLYYPRPVASARYQLSEKLGLAFPTDQPVLLYVGSEIPRKNLPVLWAALARVRKIYPDAILLKVGKSGGKPGQREATQADIARHLPLDAVRFLENIDDATLPLFYNAADVFVQPSLYEGFSLPTAEALASGCPVAVARATCLPEVVGDSAVLFDPYSPDACAESVLSLFEDAQFRQTLIERGLQRAQLFDWRTTAQKTIDIYAKMVK